MPLKGKAKKLYQREYMKQRRGLTNEANSNLNVRPSVQPVQPSVQPVQHCRLPFCVICDPERYQEWFKQTYGYYDDHYI